MTDVRRALISLFTLGLWLGLAHPVAAHGVLERSNPPANSTLGTSPRQVVLWFNEPVDPSFGTVVILDREGKAVGERPTHSKDGRQVTVPLMPMVRGLHTVKWRALSTVDGHTTAGAFAFAVGEAVSSTAGASVAGPGPVRIAIRWIGFLAAVVLTGAVLFQVGVLRPALTRLELPPQQRQRLQDSVARQLRLVKRASAIGLLLSVAVDFALDATLLLDVPFFQALLGGGLWSLLGGTKAGWSVVVRAAMALVLLLPDSASGRILQTGAAIWFVVVAGLAAAFGGPVALVGSIHFSVIVLVAAVYGLVTVLMALILPQVPDLDFPEFTWAAPLVAAVLLAGLTMAAHASGSGPIAMVADWIHLLAAATWLGGLACLLLVLRTTDASLRPRLAQGLVPRFSQVAGISLGVVVVTGIYSAWVHVPSLRSFTLTAYGRTLLLKLAFIVPLMAFGAFNRFVLRPRLVADRSSTPRVVHRFLRSIAGEVGLAATVLLVVAVLTITPPVRSSAPAAAQKPFILAGVAADLRVQVAITPSLPGWNRIEVTVTMEDGQAIGRDVRVLVRLTKIDEDLDPTTIVPVDHGQGRYSAEGGELALPGLWDVQVIVRRSGQIDASASFPLALGEQSTRPADVAASALLEAAQRTFARTQTWRQLEQITDGVGGVAVTTSELARPDRLHYKNASGLEGVIIKDVHFQRFSSRPWERRPLTVPFAVRSPLPTEGAEGSVLGKQTRCDDEPCQVVMWKTQGGAAMFAAWIGMRTKRPYKVFMVLESHYMTLHLSDFDAPLDITPPP